VCKDVLRSLESLRNPEAVNGMIRFGITPNQTYGVSIPNLRAIAKEIGKDTGLALKLWDIDTRETRIIASMIHDPKDLTEDRADEWVEEFDYWEICDQVCMNLFEDVSFAYEKAIEWSSRKEEFVKRAGFVLMARLAVSDKKADDSRFEIFLPLIRKESTDERTMVKKGVNWALRQIGKRNLQLNEKAIALGREIKAMDSKSAKWVVSDALKELESEAVQKRLHK